MSSYVHGPATVCNLKNTEVKIVLASVMQFPKLNKRMPGCVTRWKAKKALQPEENKLVTDDEPEMLYLRTSFRVPYET